MLLALAEAVEPPVPCYSRAGLPQGTGDTNEQESKTSNILQASYETYEQKIDLDKCLMSLVVLSIKFISQLCYRSSTEGLKLMLS